MGQLTESIVEFITGEAVEQAPAAALDTVCRGFADTLGVMLAATGEPLTHNLWRAAREDGGQPISRVMLSPHRATVSQASLIGAGAAHALDYDDYAFSNHVSALLVPAILAEAERANANGLEMLNAYLVGMQCWGAVMKREPDHLHSKGWHPTGTFGPLGVALALARLRRLTPEQTRNALGLACAHGGGVMDNFGSQAKAYQGARAARAGVVCVELAACGIDAGPHALDGGGGLLAALSPAGRVDLSTPATWLGNKWIAEMEGLNMKRHPMVGASQRAIDAAIQLAVDHAPEAERIERITVRISEKHAAVMRFHQPRNALEAKFSVEFGVCAALLAGRVGLSELTDEFVARDRIQRLMARVTLEVGPDDDPTYPVGAKSDSVALGMTDGTTIESEPVRRFRGHGENPMTNPELLEKFSDCVHAVLTPEAAQELFEQLLNLRTLQSVDDLPHIPISLPGAV